MTTTNEYFGLSVSDPVLVDPLCFRLWLAGRSVEHATASRVRQWPTVGLPGGALADDAAVADAAVASPRGGALARGPADPDAEAVDNAFLQDLLLRDTLDQYRMLGVVEHHLRTPRTPHRHALCPLAPRVRAHLVARYYAYDDAVLREFLGRLLTRKMRSKELDDISQPVRKSGQQLLLCVLRIESQFP
jgi:hypothetical protein